MTMSALPDIADALAEGALTARALYAEAVAHHAAQDDRLHAYRAWAGPAGMPRS